MLSKNLKYLRLKNNYSQDYIAKLLDKKSFTTVQKWESGVSEPPLWVVGKLAKLYGESLDTLANIDIEKRDDNIFAGQLSADTFDYIHIPVGIAAGALETCEGLMDLPTVNLPDFLLGKYARNKNIVIMHVNGESMNKVIQNGSTIAVLTGLALENVHDGDIVVAATDRGEYTIKHFIDDKKNSRIILRPDSTDSSFADLPFSYEEAQSIKIFGKVVIYSVNL
ncbi:S24 family peptidase [Megasphaera elsdenii]|uniref:S24 family peptidase n=1 Tax=Megasphaera elsdenii TaxID=907 RepID=UPI0036F3B764